MVFMLPASRIAALLAPFLDDAKQPPELIPQCQTYLDLLLRWNARMNLTAIRDPEQIVTRHFGESLFAGQVLLQSGGLVSSAPTLADIGSGPGFPGIPIKLLAPEVHLTLIESQQKKATFLREVIRALSLPNAEVFCGRAEAWGKQAQVITMRAVEDFPQVLDTSSKLITPGGTLCLLISRKQIETTRLVLRGFFVEQSIEDIWDSVGRVVYLAKG